VSRKNPMLASKNPMLAKSNNATTISMTPLAALFATAFYPLPSCVAEGMGFRDC
jgi:hypothetical protein